MLSLYLHGGELLVFFALLLAAQVGIIVAAVVYAIYKYRRDRKGPR